MVGHSKETGRHRIAQVIQRPLRIRLPVADMVAQDLARHALLEQLAVGGVVALLADNVVGSRGIQDVAAARRAWRARRDDDGLCQPGRGDEARHESHCEFFFARWYQRARQYKREGCPINCRRWGAVLGPPTGRDKTGRECEEWRARVT